MSIDLSIQIALVIAVLFTFYIVLIRPQIWRIRQHDLLIAALKPGDQVILAGGLIGTITESVSAERVVVDLGSGIQVTAVRSSVESVLQD